MIYFLVKNRNDFFSHFRFDCYLDSPAYTSQSSTASTDLNNEFDHLLSDINIDSSLANFNTWPNDFYSDLFPNQTDSATLT